MYSQMLGVIRDNGLKIKKEDKDLLDDSVMEIQKLNNLIQTVQSSQEGLRDKFRKELNQIIPKIKR